MFRVAAMFRVATIVLRVVAMFIDSATMLGVAIMFQSFRNV
jgi:hypothetical protein